MAAQSGTALLIAVSLLSCGTRFDASPNGSGGNNENSGGLAAGGRFGDDNGGSAGNGGGGRANAEGGIENRGGAADLGGAGASGSGESSGSGGIGGVAMLPACPGFAHPPNGCRTNADCTSFMCSEKPYAGSVCGACFPTIRECTLGGFVAPNETQCDVGEICVAESNPNPCQCMGPSTFCVPACTPDSCSENEACGPDGRCGPKSCEDGYQCPSGTVCDPSRAIGHGCAPGRCDLEEMTCSDDEVCDPEISTAETHCRLKRCDLDETTCPDDLVCDPDFTASQSRCRAKRCSEGATCEPNHHCDPDQDRCARLKCQSDADCDCGACIQGTCREHLYYCVMLPA